MSKSLILLKKLYKKTENYISNEFKEEIINHFDSLDNITLTLSEKDKLIESIILNYYGLETFITKSRLRKVVNARQIFCYLQKKHNSNNFTLTRIGSLIEKDHATVLHGIKTINNLLEYDWQTQYDLNKLELTLKILINEI